MAIQETAAPEPLAPSQQEHGEEYPCFDGVRFSENPKHCAAKSRAYMTLMSHFRNRPSVLVGCDMLLYYEKGNVDASLAPDVYVSFGVGPMGGRETYKVWAEGKPPEFVLEMVTRRIVAKDVRLPELYAGIGVREYWLLDPKRLLLGEPLEGSRLVGGVYRRIQPVRSADGRARLPSEALGLHLSAKHVEEGAVLEVWDPQSCRELLTGPELSEQYERRKAQLAQIEREVLAERTARMEVEAQLERATEPADRTTSGTAEQTERD